MRLILLVAVVLTVATGCQTSPRVSSHIEMLNSEKRILEDELYDLEYDLEDALEELDQLRSENARLHQRLGTSSIPPPLSSPRRSNSTKKSKAPPMFDEGLLAEPRIEVPDQKPNPRAMPESKPAPQAPGVPMSFVTPVDSQAAEPGLLSLVPPERAPQPISSVSSGPDRLPIEPADPRITQIYLDPLLTGGSDFDRQAGDDGVVVALEPRNQENQFVSLAGPISVVLLDPTQDQEHARVARWDLEAGDIDQVIRASTTEPGIRLRLPWPNGAPQNNRLQLFVRYVTVDGRKIEASREIFVTLPGQFSQRWTPRSSGRTRVLAANPNENQRADPTAEESPIKSSESKGPVEAASHSEDVEAVLDQGSPSANVANKSAPKWGPQR